MENLPVEMLCKIFYYLDLKEILKCRSVNKQWNSIIKNSIRIKKLVIGESFDLISKTYHEFTYEHIRTSYCLFTANLKLLSCSFNSFLKNLKKLLILDYYLSSRRSFSYCDLINQFTSLEHLEIDWMHMYQNGVLKLSNLRILSIVTIRIELTKQYSLRFKTPKLNALKMSHFAFASLQFDFPASITHLSIEWYEPDFLELVNLERLDLEIPSDLPVDILSIFPKLKILNCLGRPLKNLISEILTSKNKRRVDFNFYFFGFKITCKNDLDNFDANNSGYLNCFNKVKYFKRILNNDHKLLDVVPYITKIDFNVLIHFYNGKQIGQDFLDKFVNVKKLVINDKFDLDQLVCFMENYKLKNLRFINCSLKQEFLNQLPIYQRNIVKFKIQNIDEKQRFDFKFIFEFNELYCFKTNLSVPYSIYSKFFYEGGYLIKFKLNGFDVRARTFIDDHEPQIQYRNQFKDFESDKKMVNFLKKLERSERLDLTLPF